MISGGSSRGGERRGFGGRPGRAGHKELSLVIRPIRGEDAETLHALRRQPSWLDFTLALPAERIADVRRFLESLGPDDHVFVAINLVVDLIYLALDPRVRLQSEG